MSVTADPTLTDAAERWREAMLQRWTPLARKPRTEAERAALALHHGLRDWEPGDRAGLLSRAVQGDAGAFLTLCLRDWPQERDAWVLPCELAEAHAGAMR